MALGRVRQEAGPHERHSKALKTEVSSKGAIRLYAELAGHSTVLGQNYTVSSFAVTESLTCYLFSSELDF
jgi:hypothetical protein